MADGCRKKCWHSFPEENNPCHFQVPDLLQEPPFRQRHLTFSPSSIFYRGILNYPLSARSVTICIYHIVTTLMHQVVTPACSQTTGVDQPPAPEAQEKGSWLGRTVATIANVCCKIGKAIMYTIKSLLKFLIYASVTPYKYIFNCLTYPFTHSKTTPALRQGPVQKLPQPVKNLEYKVVTDPQRVQDKLKKELCAAERQLTHCPKAFAGDPRAAVYYQGMLGIELPSDRTHAQIIRRIPPFSGKATIHYEPIPGTQTGIASSQGARPSMEDAHIADRFTVMINHMPVEIDITGIFDGHGGSGWSQYASQHIIRHLKRSLEKWNPDGLNDTGIWNALKWALVDLDNEGPLIPPGQPAEPFIHELQKSGTTANIALRINGDLWVINLGDSRAILIDNNGQTRQISEDAEPDDPRYKHSIEKRGGCVINVNGTPRVNGQLAVARSLGDHSLNGAISARGKVTKIPAGECSRGTLIQVCDGITEVAFSEDIARTVQHQLDQGKPVHVAAARPVAKAYQAGSGDNMSVMVTQLQPSAPPAG
ncbi:PP2C family serine/threonine-protein phosphatase [Endozoicomonas atrinae]|uniref:PP2C family serine/threonine-protein phosphatase n=1 Tax=Endozoicomonas atrinae TaxID=1333660 RepID=UPI003B0085C6